MGWVCLCQNNLLEKQKTFRREKIYIFPHKYKYVNIWRENGRERGREGEREQELTLYPVFEFDLTADQWRTDASCAVVPNCSNKCNTKFGIRLVYFHLLQFAYHPTPSSSFNFPSNPVRVSPRLTLTDCASSASLRQAVPLANRAAHADVHKALCCC